jgi:hypothetical protein
MEHVAESGSYAGNLVPKKEKSKKPTDCHPMAARGLHGFT